MKKVLFVSLHRPDRSPSQRFRFEQYLDYLNENGYQCNFSWLLNAAEDKYFYSRGMVFRKAFIVLGSIWKRLKEISSASKYDIVFVQREAFMLGTSFFERWFAKRSKLIFDFDDSIWLQNVSAANKMFSFFKNADKTKNIISKANLVFAGNNYLADYAKQFNQHVVIIPTTIDTDLYKPIDQTEKDRICIGWSGSVTTIEHMETKMNALKAIKNIYGDRVYFKIVGDGNYSSKELQTKGLPWKKESELQDMAEFDIGIMPLPDTEWAKGKCGLKGLQYMALGVPTIMSPVGVNSEIIQDGENGFLADSDEEWVNKLSLLIESFELRKKFGNAGRKTVEEKYSIHANSKLYLRYFDQLTS
ncbi:MAG TPA: glycosyltransferase family 4 protein [Chitinophagaceae bacterium]|nr:glycosyltransferase family 4 protein [Chitinophagaceae bacterium]